MILASRASYDVQDASPNCELPINIDACMDAQTYCNRCKIRTPELNDSRPIYSIPVQYVRNVGGHRSGAIVRLYNIHDCLRHWTDTPHMLDGCHCPPVDGQYQSREHWTMRTLPDVLVLHLARHDVNFPGKAMHQVQDMCISRFLCTCGSIAIAYFTQPVLSRKSLFAGKWISI